jgi:hypothetical protein
MAQHQLGETDDESQSRAVLKAHIDSIEAAAGGSHELTALGTDLDGFIKPTIEGVELASDMPKVEGWIRESYPDDADAILHENARGVLRKAFAARAST